MSLQSKKGNFDKDHSNTPSQKQETISPQYSKLRRRILRHTWMIRIGLVAVLFLVVFGSGVLFIRYFFGNNNVAQLYLLARRFLFPSYAQVKQVDNRTNILVLGKGGEEHTAPDLTDTIIVASLDQVSGKVDLVSLSRDIWVPALRAKLNSAYYWGNQKQPGGGLILAKSTVEEIIGEPIHYGLVIDFTSFTRIIDALGGVEVEVGSSFVDEKYPIPGREEDLCSGDREYKCRYETISFEKGLQTMDGETALKFVRSRNAQGDEGTDLARSVRQQKVIQAIARKLVNPLFVARNPEKIQEAIKVANSSIETDISEAAQPVLARKLISARGSVESHAVPENILVNPPVSRTYDFLYVFVPAEGSWDELHMWVDCTLGLDSCKVN